MDEVNEQVSVRREKVAKLREAGINPYPNDFRPLHLTQEIHDSHGRASAEELEASADTFSVAGRVLALRKFGKASFLQLRDRAGAIQVYTRRDKLGSGGYEVMRGLDVGDLVGVNGRLFRTRTNELTIEATELRLLGKCLRPLPEKWHGLTDVEIRYRQRYVDLMVNPEVREVFEKRSRIIQLTRQFLVARGFLEVETPMMQSIAGGAAAKPFITHHNALDLDLYLRVAPELFLKRLLVGGFERVFELNRNFRNEGISIQHNPEFTMLEFYQAFAHYEDMMDLTEELFLALAQAVCGSTQIMYGDDEIDLHPPWKRLSLVEGIQQYGGADAAQISTLEALRRFADDKALKIDPGLSYGKLLVEVFENLVESQLVQPTFVTGYPLEVSPLARRNEADPTFVDRFELFIGGRELANAFSELNDPADQRERFLAQAAARSAGDETASEADEDYVRALEYAMPPAAGEGIGIDRLVMLLTNSPSIRDVILFPLLRPER